MPQDPRLSETDGKLVAFDQSRDPMLVVEGPQQRVCACNDAATTMLGDRDLIGRPLREAADDVLADALLDLYDEAYRTGVAQSDDRWAITPWRDDNGSVRGVIGVATEPVTSSLVGMVQDALLPADLPVVPCLDVAGRYLLAPDSAAGGDWFDAVVRPDGRVALVTGDVVGHGIGASAVMGQLRAVLHEHLITDQPLTAALSALDRYARVQPESRAATVCVAEIDPRTGLVDYCTAGHPPPLVVTATGHTRFLVPTGAGPLATDAGLATRHDRLEPADLLLLYSDGLLHRPGTTATRSTVELSTAVADAATGRPPAGASARAADHVCALTLDQLVHGGGHDDDITVLAAHRVPPLLPFSATLPAQPSSVTRTRAAMADWLAPLELRPVDDMAVHHALDELMANVVNHAYVDASAGQRTVRVHAELDAHGDLVCTVGDSGRWQPPGPSGDGGRGLALVRGLVDSLRLEHGPGGTTATFRHRLGRPVQLLSATPAGLRGPVEPGRQAPYSARREGPLLNVRGALGQEEADQLRVDLQLETRGRTLPLQVDLSEVTHLASAAVQVLHEVVAIDGAELVLHAPAGTIAQHVLDQAQVPYRPVPVN